MTRIPLAYPKIPGSSAAPLAQCIAFEKYDGTNIHWMWNREIGWHAFGMRRNRYDLDEDGIVEFGQNHDGFTGIADLFNDSLRTQLDSIFREHTDYECDDIVVFTEYLGDKSFAGLHKSGDTKRLVLIDVQIDSGIIPPSKFIADFASLNIARVVYRGKLTGKFAEQVRNGEFDVFEGVVCKGGETSDTLWMAKIKTNDYMERLKTAFSGNWEAYWE